MTRKVILDVDTGVDDALALLLALRSPELEVVGVTCVAGNAILDRVIANTLAVLDLAGAPEIPVAIGARKPLMAELRTASFFHGQNGLADVALPVSNRVPINEDAPTFLTRTAREQPGEVTVVAVGPLTNIALAILSDSCFASNIDRLVVMGGSVAGSGNATAAAEANFSNDPEGASAVVQAGSPLELVDLGATTQTVLAIDVIESLQSDSALGTFAARILRVYGNVYTAFGEGGAVLHDPLAVGLAALPDLAKWLPVFLTVETEGRHSRGATFGNFTGLMSQFAQHAHHRDVVGLETLPFNATVARSIDVPRFLDIFRTRLDLRG